MILGILNVENAVNPVLVPGVSFGDATAVTAQEDAGAATAPYWDEVPRDQDF